MAMVCSPIRDCATQAAQPFGGSAASHSQSTFCHREEEMKVRFSLRLVSLSLAVFLLGARVAFAAPQQMHIMEGFLPLQWAVVWWVVAIPFWVIGFVQTRRILIDKPELRALLGLAGGFIFVLSALKLPSVTGSSSHPTGTGIGVILFGPFVVTILGTIALIFQALLLAHGGISTLGANTAGMAIAGPLLATAVWYLLRGRVPGRLSVFVTVLLADLFTYVVTATQLALAFPDPAGGLIASWLKFMGIFAVTQVPLAVSEGILAVLIFNALHGVAMPEFRALGLKGI
jgi:cobalt/nickel transport system permease protein